MKWQCKSLEYALVLDTYHSSQNPSLFSFWFFKKSLSCEPTLPQTSPENPPCTHLSSIVKIQQTPLSFKCWNPKPVYVLRKTLSHFNLQTVPPIPNPSESIVPETSLENPSWTHLSFHCWIPQPVSVLWKTINQFYLAF